MNGIALNEPCHFDLIEKMRMYFRSVANVTMPRPERSKAARSRIHGLYLAALGAFLCFSPVVGRSQTGYDTGSIAPAFVEQENPLFREGHRREGLWLRSRSMPNPSDLAAVRKDRSVFAEVQRRGYRICVVLEIGSAESGRGIRAGGGRRLPSNLRDAYEWARGLGEAYGGSVDRWEIGNEPDIGFLAENPETYAAFLKATALGFHEGERRAAFRAAPRSSFGKQWFLTHTFAAAGPRDIGSGVVMAGMALPPGPYFERLQVNGLLSYSNGFNFHYYGYAEDFSGVYRQFQDAVESAAVGGKAAGPRGLDDTRDGAPRIGGATQLRERPAGGLRDHEFRPKTLPVLMTEYGYGTLSEPAATTVEGRVRQWEWFRSVAEQTRALRIEGPMAFVLLPYLEHGTQEFGLLMKPGGGAARGGFPVGGGTVDLGAWRAGETYFQPADFGSARAEPWMKGIGRKMGENEASPALAWLLARPVATQPSLAWTANVVPASPIVIDFIAGNGAAAVKMLQGYALAATKDDASGGQGQLRIYNFSDRPISGQLDLGVVVERAGGALVQLTLAPGEMREVPVTLAISEREFRPTEWTVRFNPATSQIAPSVFSTLLYPDGSRMARRVVGSLDQGEAGTENAKILDTRPLAKEEPAKVVVGRWRVTPGVSVSEQQGVWTFSITKYPDQPLHPVMAELVVPDGFGLPEHSLFELDYRLAERVEAGLVRVEEPRVPRAGSSVKRETMAICWRTENGNLFTVGPTAPATPLWQRYAQAKSSFTMDFYGRANLPWRFAESRPVALVLKFYPNYLPATFEVRATAVATYGR